VLLEIEKRSDPVKEEGLRERKASEEGGGRKGMCHNSWKNKRDFCKRVDPSIARIEVKHKKCQRVREGTVTADPKKKRH